MFTNILKWAFRIGEKEAHLLLDSDMDLAAVKEIAHQIIRHCGNVEDQIKAQQEAKAAEEAPKPEEVPSEIEAIVEPVPEA